MSLLGDLTWHNAEKSLWRLRCSCVSGLNIFTWQLKCNYQPRSRRSRWEWRSRPLSRSYRLLNCCIWGGVSTQHGSACLETPSNSWKNWREARKKRHSPVNAVLQQGWNCIRRAPVLDMQCVISWRRERAYKNMRNTTQSALPNNHWELRHCWLIALVKAKAFSVLTVNWPLEARRPWRKSFINLHINSFYMSLFSLF